jgi:predicted nucleic acid-binding protein
MPKRVSSKITILRDHPSSSRKINQDLHRRIAKSINNTTTSAVVISSFSIEEEYILEKNSSISTALIHDILKAMESMLQHNDPISAIIIYYFYSLEINHPGP